MSDEDRKKITPPAPPSSRHLAARMQPPPRVTVRLTAIDFDVVNACRRILEGALGVVPGERVLVLLDRARAELASVLNEVAQSLGAIALVFVVEEFGERPLRELPAQVLEALTKVQASILLVGNNDDEFSMRRELLTYITDNRLRHAHMVGVTRASLLTGFSIDPSRILDATRAVRTRIRPDSKLHLRSHAGSDLTISIPPAHRWVEHVGAIRPGRWENLPTGALVTAVGDASGVFVCDASLGAEIGASVGTLERTPVRFEIEAGVCKHVKCTDLSLQRSVEEILRREHDLDRVGLVILGTNLGIVRATGEICCDQNMPGLHIGFGATFPETTGASWTSRGQLLATSNTGDVDLDGAPIIRSGRYMVS
jgi:leucyl aminopeptidase (aminopeptidase T)